jgi:hypothetical protein
MSRNIAAIYLDNPSTTLAPNDLLYSGLSPYDTKDDSAIKYSDLLTQLKTQMLPLAGSSVNAVQAQRSDQNIFIGINTAIGSTGYSNVGIGKGTMQNAMDAAENVAIGLDVFKNGNGAQNVFVGITTGISLITSSYNVAMGAYTYNASTTGQFNTIIGGNTCNQLLTGNYNTIFGANTANEYTTSESSNIVIANPGVQGESHVARIGDTGSGDGQITDTYLAGNIHFPQGQTVSVTQVTTSTYTTLNTDYVLSCNRAGAIAIGLISSPETGKVYRFKDISGAAASNNITITPASGNIDGSASYVLNTNYGAIDVIYTGSQWSIL